MINPSPYQLAIWEHFKSRPREHLVVEALAGSGKTTTLVEGLDHMAYGSTLVTSFGASIVDELNQRISRTRARVKTLHGLGMSMLLRRYREMSREPDRDKAGRHIAQVLNEHNLFAANPTVRELSKVLEWAKATVASTPEQALAALDRFDTQIPLDGQNIQAIGHATEFLEDEDAAKFILMMLERCALDTTTLDFDDMVWMPLVRAGDNLIFDQFEHALVDEAQDLNPAQIVFARQLVRGGGRLMAVGDRFQSIYQFRGADSEAMNRIVEGFGARTLPLSITYRCDLAIVDEAKKYVPAIEPRPDAARGLVQKMKFDELAEMAEVGDFILSRNNAGLARIALELQYVNKPVIQLGRDIGQQYVALIRRSKRTNIDALCDWLDEHLEERRKKMKKRDRAAFEALEDRVLAIKNFAVGKNTVKELIDFINTTYTDQVRDNSVVLSTVHQAKGKERDRVYLLWDTFLKRPGQEEKNIAYVALTRAKKELYYVEGSPYNVHLEGESADEAL